MRMNKSASSQTDIAAVFDDLAERGFDAQLIAVLQEHAEADDGFFAHFLSTLNHVDNAVMEW